MLNGVPRYPEIAARVETEMTKMIIFGPGRRSIGDNQAYGLVRHYRHMLGLVTRARKYGYMWLGWTESIACAQHSPGLRVPL
ncbi:hypothetical protein L204_105367 [Cryptococcus depauperatus]